MCCLHVCVCLTLTQSLWKAENCVESPRTGLIEDDEPSHGFWGPNPGCLTRAANELHHGAISSAPAFVLQMMPEPFPTTPHPWHNDRFFKSDMLSRRLLKNNNLLVMVGKKIGMGLRDSNVGVSCNHHVHRVEGGKKPPG